MFVKFSRVYNIFSNSISVSQQIQSNLETEVSNEIKTWCVGLCRGLYCQIIISHEIKIPSLTEQYDSWNPYPGPRVFGPWLKWYSGWAYEDSLCHSSDVERLGSLPVVSRVVMPLFLGLITLSIYLVASHQSTSSYLTNTSLKDHSMILGCPWNLVTIVSKLVYNLLKGLTTYLYKAYNDNPFTKVQWTCQYGSKFDMFDVFCLLHLGFFFGRPMNLCKKMFIP